MQKQKVKKLNQEFKPPQEDGLRNPDLMNTWVIIPVCSPCIHLQIHASTLSLGFAIIKHREQRMSLMFSSVFLGAGQQILLWR